MYFRTETAAQSPSSSSAATTGGQPDYKAATMARRRNSGDSNHAAAMERGRWAVMDGQGQSEFSTVSGHDSSCDFLLLRRCWAVTDGGDNDGQVA
ncbi:hypothetical protein MRB53_032124 [Persea americana]|uniref:Uncharacterized protein n=1 Tax=Persea americana TaxID=3435 RepID=A0ACC2KR00_PERAE|nr:hypothetical protein MRB53_032124 [Persea americana]